MLFVGSLNLNHFQRLRSHVNPTFVGVVGLDVPDVVPGELVDGLLDLGQAALLAHPLRREVGVRTRPAPLTLQNINEVTLEELAFATAIEFDKRKNICKVKNLMKHEEISKKPFRIAY